MLKKFTAALICVCLLSPTLPVRANENPTDEQSSEQYDTLTLTYEEACETALANLTDLSLIDNDVRQTESQKAKLEKQIRDLNSYISKERNNRRGYNDLIKILEEDIDILDEEILDAVYSDDGDGVYLAAAENLRSQRSALRQRLDDINALLNSRDDSEFSRNVIQKNIDILNKQAELMELNREAFGPAVELSLRGILTNIADYDLDAELLDESILLGEENVRRIEIMNQLGKASGGDLRDAEYALAQSKAGLETLLTARENERKKLNTLLRQPMSLEIIIEYSFEEEELPADTDKFIEETFANDTGVKQMQKLIEIRTMEYGLKTELAKDSREHLNDTRKDYNRDQGFIDDDEKLYRIAPELEPEQDIDDNQGFIGLKQDEWDYDQLEYDRENARLAAETAQRELDDARLDMEASVHTRLNALTQLTQKEASLLADIENAEAHLNMTEIRLNTGKATRYEADLASFEVTKLYAELEKTKNAKWLTQFLLQYPLLKEE